MGSVMQMTQLLVDVATGLSLPIKLAWVVWLVWAVAYVVWSRHSRTARPKFSVSMPPPRPRPRAVPPPKTASSPSVRVAAAYGVPDFITALDREQQRAAPEPKEAATV